MDGYIAGGGCYLEYDNQVIYNHSFEQERISRIVNLLKISNIPFSIESQQKVFMNQSAKVIFEEMNKKKRNSSISNKKYLDDKIIYKNNMNEFHNQPIHKICLWGDELILSKVKNILKDTFELAQSDSYKDFHYYEIIQKGFNKGDAIEKLQKTLEISKTETISFGDGLNDIEMFKKSNVCVAMMNSHKKLKKVATSICDEPMKNGIYNELKRLSII